MKKALFNKKRIFAFCCVVMIAFSADCNIKTVEAKTVQELQNERAALAQKTKNAKAALEEAKKNQVSMKQEIDAMDHLVVAASEEYNKSLEDLEEVKGRLAQSEADLEAAEKEREEHIEIFGERIKFFYENGNYGYMDVIFQSKSIGDMLSRMQYVEEIMQYDKKMLDALEIIEERIDRKIIQIEEEKKAVEAIVAENKKIKDELDAIYAEKNAMLRAYENDEKKYNQMILNNEATSLKIEQLIKEAQTATTVKTVYTGGKLNWPVPAKVASSSSLSSGFVNRISPITGKREKHTGYDIPAPYGSNIVAAEAGTVIYSGWMSGYGNTIMINHGGGIVTLYAHNSSLVAKKGESVSRGQTVAKCGSTGWSTGNHCHFEVRVNGSAVSPEPYLGVKNVSY